MIDYKPFEEIKEEYTGIENIRYDILLSTTEWQAKRNKIIKREKNICEVCKKKTAEYFLPKSFGKNVGFVPATLQFVTETRVTRRPFVEDYIEYEQEVPKMMEMKEPLFSHVHHKFYVNNYLPWEYQDEDLMHLCHKCHFNIHQNETIYFYESYDDKGNMSGIPIESCSKCGGTGYIAEYYYYLHGICFECNGKGFDSQ